MAIHGLTDTRTNRFVFEISLDGFGGHAEEVFIIKCGGHVAVICLFECVYEHEIARQAHDDNVSSLAATSQRKTALRPLADEKLFFCSPDSGHECEFCFLFNFLFESERKEKKQHFINDRSVNTYCFRRKGNETMTKSKTKRTRQLADKHQRSTSKPHNGYAYTRNGFEEEPNKERQKKNENHPLDKFVE